MALLVFLGYSAGGIVTVLLTAAFMGAHGDEIDRHDATGTFLLWPLCLPILFWVLWRGATRR